MLCESAAPYSIRGTRRRRNDARIDNGSLQRETTVTATGLFSNETTGGYRMLTNLRRGLWSGSVKRGAGANGHRAWFGALLVLLFVGSTAAHATGNTNCTAGATNGSNQSINIAYPCTQKDSGQGGYSETVIVQAADGPFAATFSVSYSNGAQSSASAQELDASVSASAQSTPAYYDYDDAGGTTARINNTLQISASPEAISRWNERFLVQAPHWSQFRVTMVVSGVPTSSGCLPDYNVNVNDAGIGAETFFSSLGNASIDSMDPLVGGQAGLGYLQTVCLGVAGNTTTGIISVKGPGGFELSAVLNANGSAWAGNTPSTFIENGDVGVSNAKMIIYIDPLTPGAPYQDSSGVVDGRLTPTSSVVVPNVVGQSQLGATTAIVETGLTVGAITQQASNSTATGYIISQSPSAGSSVAGGSPVNLLVSTGPAQVSVPNVVAMTQAAGTAVAAGGMATVDLTISGLTAGTALGTFDLSVGFNDSVVSYAAAVFGDPVLGDQLNLQGFGPVTSATAGRGTVELFEVSLDSPSALTGSQASIFTLAQITFNAISSGVSSLALSINSVGDQNGGPIAATLHNGAITVGSGNLNAPEIDPASAVGAMTLLLGTLAALRGRRSISVGARFQ